MPNDLKPAAWAVMIPDMERPYLVYADQEYAEQRAKQFPGAYVEKLFTYSQVRQAVAGALREAAVAAQPVRDAEPMARQVLDLVVADLRRRADKAEKEPT